MRERHLVYVANTYGHPRRFVSAAEVPTGAASFTGIVDRVERDAGTTLVEPPRPPILDALHSE